MKLYDEICRRKFLYAVFLFPQCFQNVPLNESGSQWPAVFKSSECGSYFLSEVQGLLPTLLMPIL